MGDSIDYTLLDFLNFFQLLFWFYLEALFASYFDLAIPKMHP